MTKKKQFENARLCALVAVAASTLALGYLAEEKPDARPEESESSPVWSDADWIMDQPGIGVDVVKPTTQSELVDASWVIGTVVNGEARAYLAASMSEPTSHLAYDSVGDSNVAVAFCPQMETCRVFGGSSSDVRAMRMGGWVDGKMQLIVGNTRLPLDSRAFALTAHAAELVTWGEWKAIHPNARLMGGVKPETELEGVVGKPLRGQLDGASATGG